MKYAMDLHIHSALSPCADEEMTPNNIINMALIKGLDIISVTDHNSCANLSAFHKCAKNSGLLLVPGMEVETSEEVHLVCLLPDIESAFKLESIISAALPDVLNREDIFGKQLKFDENDRVVGEEKRMLITATNLSVNEVFLIVKRFGGAVIPAHVDRPSYSMLSNLGMIPEDLDIKYLEISRNCDKYSFKASKPELDPFSLIKSSDAHHLEDILERESMLELDELSAQALIKAIGKSEQVKKSNL